MTITIGIEMIITILAVGVLVTSLWCNVLNKKIDNILQYYEFHKQIANLILQTWICMLYLGAIIGGLIVVCIYK